MADAKISALTDNTTPAYGDMVPLVNVDGADETQRTSLGLLQNWITVDDTWTYLTATAITVPAGAASRYSAGDKVKFTQTTVKYFYVTLVSDTVLYVTGGTSHTLADAAISAIAFSKSVIPVGFPQWMTCAAPAWDTATIDNGTGSTQPTAGNSYFSINGNTCTLKIITGGSGCVKVGSDNLITFTVPLLLPEIADSAITCIGSAYTVDDSAGVPGVAVVVSSTSITLRYATAIADDSAIPYTGCIVNYRF